MTASHGVQRYASAPIEFVHPTGGVDKRIKQLKKQFYGGSPATDGGSAKRRNVVRVAQPSTRNVKT